MYARKAIAVLVLLVLLSLSAVPSAASSYYTIETYVNPGKAHGEGFTLSANANFGWEVWVYSSGNVTLMIMDDANYQQFRTGQSFSSLVGPTTVAFSYPSFGNLTVPDDGKYWLVVESNSPNSVEVQITLIDVPFFSTDMGQVVLVILQAIGAVVLIIFIIAGLLVIRGRMKRDKVDKRSTTGTDDYEFSIRGGSTPSMERSGSAKKDEDQHRAIDPFQDDPYIRSKPLLKRRK